MKWSKKIFQEGTVEFTTSIVNYSDHAKKFVQKYHYSKTLPKNCSINFILKHKGVIFGIAMFGCPFGKSYDPTKTIECKRFVLRAGQLKNVSSWFMAKCIKQIKAMKKYDEVLSFADPEAGHSGGLYRAANFEFRGEQSKKGQVITYKGENLHLRQVYQKRNGVYTKPAQEVQAALKTGEAKYKSVAKKKIFMYDLKKR